WVLDTTRSMQPFIDAMRETIAKSVEEMAKDPQLKGHIRFGLVCYRDAMQNEEDQKKMEYVVKVISDLTTDHEEFLRRIKDVREADIGSEDVPEDLLAGAH